MLKKYPEIYVKGFLGVTYRKKVAASSGCEIKILTISVTQTLLNPRI